MTAGGAALRHVIMLECASQTLAHSRMVPPATTSKITPQSHQSFLSPNLLIANKTAVESRGSAANGREQRGPGELISCTGVPILLALVP
jgi:hypothetical protein